jgi:predicted kinase
MTIGISGSGKSTLVQRLTKFYSDLKIPTRLLNPDSNLPRCESTNDRIHNQQTIRQAWNNVWQEAGQSLVHNMPVIIFDATFLTSFSRSTSLHLMKGAGYNVIGIHFQIPFNVCKERNLARFDSIPEDVIDNQLEIFQLPQLDEGFDLLYHVDQNGSVVSVDGEPRLLYSFFNLV